MKKLFFFAAAVLAMLSAASCQKEPVASVEGGNAVVSLSIALPEAPQTRAIAQAENADIVYFEVWNSNWTNKLPVYDKDGKPFNSAKVTNRKANIELTLVADQTYNFLFWAQDKDCGAYDVTDLKNVKIKYDVMADPKGKDDSFDAFYKADTIKVNGAVNETVVLYRPFAQLNFATNRMKTSFGDVVLGDSEVTVKGLATSFNTIKGVGEIENEPATVTFKAYGLATDVAGKTEMLKTNGGEYTWLTMDYMLMKDKSDLVEVEASFDLGMQVPVEHKIANVPLKKNYRTNIIGDVFAADAKLQIIIDQAFLKQDEDIKVGVPEEIYPDAAGVYNVEKAAHVLWLSQESNETPSTFDGATISFAADAVIDMMGQGFLPINIWTDNSVTVLGNGCTVSNYAVRGDSWRAGDDGEKEMAGLFGNFKGSITDLHVKDVLVEGNYHAGALVGHIYGSVTDCSAENVEINSIPYASIVDGTFIYDDGNSVGGLIGYIGENGYEISGNTVTNASVTGYRRIGGLVGQVQKNATVNNNTVSNSEVIADLAYEPHIDVKEPVRIGEIVGYMISDDDLSDNTVNETVITYVHTTTTIEDLQAAINDATESTVIRIADDIKGDLTLTQKADVNVVINGENNKFEGVIVVDGKSATYTSAGFTIRDLTFDADAISADACIRLGDGTNATRYTCNVTVENCTFDVPGAVGIKSYTGGDKNLTITGCTATANAHSLVQAKGIDGILIEGCVINSKNGMNFNNSTNVVVDNCTADTKGYAARFGESSGDSGAAEVYAIKNSSLKSACDDGDAVIILRGTADYSTLTIENTTLTGTTQITNTATGAKVIIDGIEQ